MRLVDTLDDKFQVCRIRYSVVAFEKLQANCGRQQMIQIKLEHFVERLYKKIIFK